MYHTDLLGIWTAMADLYLQVKQVFRITLVINTALYLYYAGQ